MLACLRLVLRVPLLSIWTLACYATWLLSRVLVPIAPGAALRAHHAAFQGWARGTARVLGMRIRSEGRPPEAPFFLVSNHLSYLDIILLATRLRCLFVSKAEVAGWPVVGFMARSMNTVFLNRGRKSDLRRAIGILEDALRKGRGVVVFPEGTSTRGAEVLPFKPSLFEAALRTGTPVETASVSYRTPEGVTPAWLSVCWWGDMTFFAHLFKLLQLPRFEATIAFGAEPVQDPDRKALAEKAHVAVERLFSPVVVPEARCLQTSP